MNSNAKVSLKTYADGYSLVVDGEESDVVEYGEPLEMVTGDGRRFGAVCEAQGEDIESLMEFWAYEMLPVPDVKIEEPEEGDSDSDEDEGDEDEDDDDEDGGVGADVVSQPA